MAKLQFDEPRGRGEVRGAIAAGVSARRPWTGLLAGLALIWIAGGPGLSSLAAQGAAVHELKAAFIFNFAKFTEWPAAKLPPGQQLALCVLGDASVADALERTISGHAVEGHELTVQVVKADGSIRSCHLLYVSGLNAEKSAQLLEALAGASVFTIGDASGFAESGGVAHLALEGDRMRFAINVAAAKRAQLTLSSKLLSLARIVKDAPNASR